MGLAYDDVGQGPVVVLLHGFPLDRSMWRGQLEGLAANHRVIAPDLPGHGQSAVTEGAPSMEAMADAVFALLDALGLTEPVALGGLSMGGYVAMAALARHPDRIRALMLMDTRATADSPEAAANRETLARKVEEAGNAQPTVDAMWQKLFARSTVANSPRIVTQTLEVMSATSAQGIASALRAMAARQDHTSTLIKAGKPTLLLVGEEDVITPPDEMRALADSLPAARHEVIPQAGHLAPLERPEESNLAILSFLQSSP